MLVDNFDRARLADFGLASLLYSEQSRAAIGSSYSSGGGGGTEAYSAPELMNLSGATDNRSGVGSVTKETDVFALGMVIYEVTYNHGSRTQE